MYRSAALAAGCFYVIFGLLSLVPPLHENWPSDEPMMRLRNGRGFLFGVFPNNFALAFLHLGAGVWGLFAFRAKRPAWLYVRSMALLFGVLAVCGILPMVNSLAGVVPTFGNTALLHIITAIVLLLAMAVGSRQPLPERTPAPAPALDAGVVSIASVAGVPVHAFLASFPLAFLLGALGTDLAHWWTTLDWYQDYEGFWGTASVWLIGSGLGSAVIASAAGLVDVLSVQEMRRRRLLSVHVLGSLTVIALAALNLAIRFQDHGSRVVPWGITLSLVTTGLLVYSGWYAGHLIHRQVISSVNSGGSVDSEVQPPSESVSIASDSASRPSRTGRQGRGTSSWD